MLVSFCTTMCTDYTQGWRDDSTVRAPEHWLLFHRTWVPGPAPTRWLSSKGIQRPLLASSGTACTRYTDTHAGKHSHTLKRGREIKKEKEEGIVYDPRQGTNRPETGFIQHSFLSQRGSITINNYY